MSDCLFCGIVAGDVPSEIVHRTDDDPRLQGHLRRPRRCTCSSCRAGTSTTPSQITAEDGPVLADMLMAAHAVAEAAGVAGPDRGYRLIFNIGPDAMNSVPHLHLHVLGGQPLKGHFALA